MSAEDGTPSSFEARSLPPDSLTKPYGHYTVVADRVPDGWAIDVSRTAAGFGRPGGAVQLWLVDETDKVVVVDRLSELKILV